MSVATVTSSNAVLVSNDIRVAGLAVSVYHYIVTLPAEYRFYRAFYRNNFRLNSLLVQFVLLRYTAMIMTAMGNWLYFSANFTPESCPRSFLLPFIFRVLLSMVSQAILGLRVYTISRKNLIVGIVLFSGYIIATVVQWLAFLYHRVPVLVNGSCGPAPLPPTMFLSPWLFYLTAMLYDLLSLAISMTYLFKYHPSSSSASRLVRMMIYDGLGYFVALTVANAIILIIYKTPNDSILQLSVSPFSSLVTWIMSQRILIDLQRASEKRDYTETAAYVHRSTRSSSAKDRLSTVDHHVSKQGGTELVQVRVDRSVVVGVGPWKPEPSEEHYRKPEVKWDQRLV